MRANKVKQFWQEKKPLAMGWLGSPDTYHVEAMANAGFDVLVLDMREQTSAFDYFVIATGTSNRQYGLRDTRFKLVNNLGKWELFDLLADSHEAINLFSNPQYAAVRGALLAEIANLNAGAAPGYFQLP